MAINQKMYIYITGGIMDTITGNLMTPSVTSTSIVFSSPHVYTDTYRDYRDLEKPLIANDLNLTFKPNPLLLLLENIYETTTVQQTDHNDRGEKNHTLSTTRTHSAKKQAELSLAKLDEQIATLETKLHEECSSVDINFDRIINRLDEIDLAERRRKQFERILEEMFP